MCISAGSKYITSTDRSFNNFVNFQPYIFWIIAKRELEWSIQLKQWRFLKRIAKRELECIIQLKQWRFLKIQRYIQLDQVTNHNSIYMHWDTNLRTPNDWNQIRGPKIGHLLSKMRKNRAPLCSSSAGNTVVLFLRRKHCGEGAGSIYRAHYQCRLKVFNRHR
jgi:hypothetical protein